MDYLIRFTQIHESFRKPETDALATLANIDLEWVFYSEESPFAIVRFPQPQAKDSAAAARSLITRSILSYSIYELWGSGHDYPSLHADVRHRTSALWPQHCHSTFRFEVDAFQGSHTAAEHRDIIESFAYTGFHGPIRMRNPDNQFVVFEEYELDAPIPKWTCLGRLIAESGRKAINKYSLKKRSYIATTSMDAELSLVTANLAHAADGKLCYDPFVGTGSFPLACAHFGASVFGSDLDGRSIRGKKGRDVKGNFKQYGTSSLYLGGFVADLTNTPLRRERFLDAILCDPPYGVREGLKVLGSNKPSLQEEVLLADGQPAHLAASYLPPKKVYSFTRMLGDILDFSAIMLVDDGRLCMWMPVAGATATDEEDDTDATEEYAVPQHPALEIVSECTQHFNKWSRRLLTYRRRHDSCVDGDAMLAYRAERLGLQSVNGVGTADDLNSFRRKYFQGFLDPALPRKHEKLPHTY
ncbi:uncharacterized protein LTR77_006599 [Saxophila tyrrhenica]|uniref:tRNA (guanine(10)-N(2))-methyltransferase n=1 Tax=Saxophila tyrrhenica TaxID=1690608 RepID=A0AAV9P5C9_9PEZI|nr:hypothetical protein LTR77_006599 [Saxophila tyrrhenica]